LGVVLLASALREEPVSGGTAAVWSPETRRRHAQAADGGGAWCDDDTEPEGEGEEVQEDLLLTRKPTVRS
jgi:hypothetical protein